MPPFSFIVSSHVMNDVQSANKELIMFIERIHLKDYVKLTLGDITEIDYNIYAVLQLIVGPNGCGKTSLLEETNPKPATPSDFRDGGFKKVWLVHGGHRYYVESCKVGKQMKHKFIVLEESSDFDPIAGENLNPGGTVGVQKELVEKYTGYTPQIHKMLAGGFSFTKATPAMREEIFTTMSGADTTYGIEVFKRLKTKHRDTVGAIKHVTSKQKDTLDKITSFGNTDDRVVELKKSKEVLHELIPLSVNNDPMLPSKRIQFVESELTLGNAIQRVMAQPRVKLSKTGLLSLSDAHTAIEEKSGELSAIAALIKANVTELDKLTHLIRKTEAVNTTPTQLEGDIAKLRAKLDTMPTVDVLDYNVDLKDVLVDLEAAIYALHIEQIPDTDLTDGKCTQEEYTQVKERMGKLNADLGQANVTKQRLEGELEKAKSLLKDTLTCADCGAGVPVDPRGTAGFISVTDAQLETHIKLISNINKHRDTTMMDGKRKRVYIDHYNRVVRVLKDAKLLHPLWGAMVGGVSWAVDNPTLFNGMLTKEVGVITSAITRLTTEASLKEHVGTLELLKAAIDNNTSSRIISLEKDLESLYNKRSKLKVGVETIEAHIQDTHKLSRTISSLETLHDDTVDKLYEYKTAHIHQGLREVIDKEQHTVGNVMHVLNQKDVLTGALKDLHDDGVTLAEQHTALSELIKALSPKTGIIGESMAAFVGGFIDQMNMVIERIWDYELLLLPCSIEETGMDYKFPLSVSGDITPNFMNGSKGQCEVIDFAFIQVMMSYSNLKEYPLYLDEVGGGFDHGHRGKFIEYLNLLTEGGECSQIFLVNHFTTEYGGLNHMDTVALGTTNVLLPEEYNTHVTIR